MRISTNKNCDIVIYDDTEYPIKGITYNNSVSLYIVQQNNSTKPEVIYNKYDLHNNGRQNPIVLENRNYGYVTIYHIIIPKRASEFDECRYIKSENFLTFDEIDQILNIQPNRSLSSTIIEEPENPDYNFRYYYENGKIYYYSDSGIIREATQQELVDVNADSCNIVKFTYNFFSVCQLRKCYIALCQQIFNDRGFDRCFRGNVDSQLIYKRDLVWAALNVIQYMVDSNQLAEAQRLLERINGCNGLCAGVNTGDNGCGCE